VHAREAITAGRSSSESATFEEVWAAYLRAALSGDADAYRQFLESVAEAVRSLVRRVGKGSEPLVRCGEDEVQDILRAIHVKRSTWDKSKPIGPWITAVVEYKLSSILRPRRIRRRFDVTFEGLAAVLWKRDRDGGDDFGESETGPASIPS
jgi:DNA-directed RNA polymerase specialized sigma24 family protein